MSDGVAARLLLSSVGFGARTLGRITAVGLDLPKKRHGESAATIGFVL
jgi:hypothetical protein